MTGDHTTTTTAARAIPGAGGTPTDESTRHDASGRTAAPAAPPTAATPPGAAGARGRRTGPAAPAPPPVPAAPTVPRPRRAPAGRRPLGPAGSGPGPAGRGPGSAGRGPNRTTPRTPRPGGPAPSGAPLPTVGAQRRAHESRPHLWFAHQLVLTLSGQRPVHALLGHALPAAYDRLVELAPQAPLRPPLGPGRRGPVPTVRECGLCRPRRGVIEAFARIAAGERLRALAFRLELGADSRWRCAALDIGPAPAAASPAP
ncbi:Rv3235 family protein [Streptomyces sp. NPDC002446]